MHLKRHAKMSNELKVGDSVTIEGEDFADDLKDLCRKHRIGYLRASFSLMIDTHSVIHERFFEYRSKEQSPLTQKESCTLNAIYKKSI